MLNTEPGLGNNSLGIGQAQIDIVLAARDWCLNASPSPLDDAAMIFALSTIGGIAARSYNIGGSGLAQYYWFMARSGAGKGTIKKCRKRLFDAVSSTVPSINDFKGIGYCGSGQAVIKYFARKRNPVCIADFDEFAHDVKEMSNPKNENAKVKQKVYLELWSLGGEGDVFEPMVYSDSEKNTDPIYSPNLTIVGTSTTQLGNEALTGNLASSGFLARANVIEYLGSIPAFNADWERHFKSPPCALVGGTASLTREVLELAARGEVRPIKVSPGAEQHFVEYAEGLRERRNGMSDVASDLLNRNLEKAKKIAGTWAVGRNIKQPLVSLEEAIWATDFIERHANRLLPRFENGEVGEEAGNESKQRAHILRTIANYFAFEMDWGNPDRVLRVNGIIRQSYIQAKVSSLPAFRDDKRRGATKAIKEMLMSMSENGELQTAEATSMSTLLQKQCKARAYYLAEPKMLEPYWPSNSPFRRVWDFFQTLSR